MKFVASMALAAAVSSAASAAFVQYVVTKTSTTNSGVALDVYRVFARFDGPTDTLLNAFNFNRLDSASTNIFYHKDNSSYNGGVLSKTYGTWAPQLTGSPTLNRPFDSFLTIGGNPVATNSTNADPSWGGAGWNRPDFPNGANVGWFNSNPPNLQGRVGVAPNTATDVLLGQFVVDAGTTAAPTTSRSATTAASPALRSSSPRPPSASRLRARSRSSASLASPVVVAADLQHDEPRIRRNLVPAHS